jgi:hypothetical protein
MTVGSSGMFMGKLAMFESRSCVLLRLFVLAEIVMMGRLMVMMRGGVVVSGRMVVMLTRWMLWCLCHLRYSSLSVNNSKTIGYFANMTRSPALGQEACLRANPFWTAIFPITRSPHT